jgi:uncharacterized protein YjbJ (UPF0337 family)
MNEDRVEGAAKNFAGKTESTFGNVTGDKDSQASGRTREMAGKAQNLYGQAKDAVQDAADKATDYAKDVYNNRGDAIRDGQEALVQKVQENPIGSLVTAGAIGFALALLLARPARRRQPRWRYYS